MPRPTRLNEEEIESGLRTIEGWEAAGGKLRRTFKFPDFIGAWGFMSRVALIAQAMDHHPDWTNVYSTVSIDLSTDDANGITRLDFELARKIDEVA